MVLYNDNMAKLGYGYGSEFHLLRLLGRHRNSFDLKILQALGYNDKRIEWLDYKYDSKQFIPDKEYIGIDFLENATDYKRLKDSWRKYWPSSNNAQNWDAICKIDNEWILIEAKAKKDEILSNSTATEPSKKFISDRFNEIKLSYGITSMADWNYKYYQKANRILFLEYLHANNIKAKLLFVYFLNGYKKNGTQLGVTSKSEWIELIKNQDTYLGIANNEKIKSKMFDLILDVNE
jgi:hypothetical protein